MKRVEQIVRDVRPHWVGDGFPVRSLFSYQEGKLYDPFLLLDYGGPYQFQPSRQPRGVGEHPHRGFETVTIVYAGELEHRDSGGNHGSIGPGDVQWMTAAGGVVHEEYHSPRFTREGGLFEVIQLWVNLPAKDKLSEPKYQAITNAQIPVVPLGGGGSLRVIAGKYGGERGPAQTFTPLLLWDISLKTGASVGLEIEDGWTTLLAVQHGSLAVNDTHTAGEAELVRFSRDGDRVNLSAIDDARALLLAGKPLGEPVVGHGPFVMNSEDEIEQAIDDYQAGRLVHH